MATDLNEIMADLRTEASRSSRADPAAAADARVALGRLRPALERLREDGLDTGASMDVDPGAFSRQADRGHWVRLLAVACDTLGQSAPTLASSGRMTDLADAAAVAATLHVDALTGGERWATVAAIARTAHVLSAAAGLGGQESPEVSRALIIAEASSSVLFQFASLDPPAAADGAALLRPVPNPTAQVTSAEDAALEASAALVHATGPGAGPHPISDILAIAIAADTTCRFAARAQLGVGDDHRAGAADAAARRWGEVREQLAPFNDGSRRLQTGRPPAVDHALTLHRVLQAAGPPTTPGTSQGRWARSRDLLLVLDRLATVAGGLDAAIVDGVAHGRIMAYAVDLPVRESRVRHHLEGRRGSGLVTADSADIRPVRSAFSRARAATAAAASGRSSPAEHARTVPLPATAGSPNEAANTAGRRLR